LQSPYSNRHEPKPPAYRAAQFQAILDDTPPDATHVIVGGDFNTVTRAGVVNLARRFIDHDLAHNNDGLDPTFMRFSMRPSATDHIFTRGFEQLEAGVLGDLTASDHLPVWVRLKFGQ
jgi:endonuclease/exonuclease/phosphatase family metal-dependent hydrolase